LLESKIQTLQGEIKEQEETLERMTKTSKSSKGNQQQLEQEEIRAAAAQRKSDKINAEVDSLKVCFKF
jgi:DNA repair exonuclease SbcCD ATPase subunit